MSTTKHRVKPEMNVSNVGKTSAKAITSIVFVALILDLLAFTLILPLFPRMIEYYRVQEISHPSILSDILKLLNSLKPSSLQHEKWDTVLLGGAVGSLFSLLQCFASPIIGTLSDKSGRKRTLLFTMFGNILSCLLWLFASNFYIFLASRVVGGLSEGNVQLSIAIISDITTVETRSRGLAMVGIAFAISFTIGPAIGAYFAHFQVDSLPTPFSCSALIALVLLIIETLFIAYALPETRPKSQTIEKQTVVSKSQALELEKLGWIHFGHLLFFSGLEFSLTFLTFDLFSYTSAQNGKLLGFIGLASTFIQGFLRRISIADKTLVYTGLFSCFFSFIILSLTKSEKTLYLSASLLAIVSATVVNNLNSLASKMANVERRGKELGRFRAMGQFGRALGPIFCCGIYWRIGREGAYLLGSAGLVFVIVGLWTFDVKKSKDS